MRCYLKSGSMNYEGTRGVLAMLHSVDNDKITKTMVKERQRCGKAGWTCTYDEDSCRIRK